MKRIIHIGFYEDELEDLINILKTIDYEISKKHLDYLESVLKNINKED